MPMLMTHATESHQKLVRRFQHYSVNKKRPTDAYCFTLLTQLMRATILFWSVQRTLMYLFCPWHLAMIGASLFLKSGSRTRTKVVDITKVAASLGSKVCKGVLGMHAFAGCDTVSAFAGRGKAQEALTELG